MNQFKEICGILALDTVKEINPQDEKACEIKISRDKLDNFMDFIAFFLEPILF